MPVRARDVTDKLFRHVETYPRIIDFPLACKDTYIYADIVNIDDHLLYSYDYLIYKLFIGNEMGLCYCKTNMEGGPHTKVESSHKESYVYAYYDYPAPIGIFKYIDSRNVMVGAPTNFYANINITVAGR